MYKLPAAIVEIIDGARLPVLPQALFLLLQSMEREDVPMAELAALVGRDPALAARVLVAANSPAFGRGRPLKTIEECLVALGTRVVHAIATCLAVQKMFDGQSGIRQLDLAGFWHHSLLTAELARALASASGYASPEEAYLSGLLHDCGQLVLLTTYGAPYQALCQKAGSDAALAPLERDWLGVDHAEVGAWLAGQWALDRGIGAGLLFHHAPAEAIATAGRLAQLVWLAQAGAGEELPAEELNRLATTMVGIADVVALQAVARQRVQLIADAMGVPVAREGATPSSLPGAEFAAAAAGAEQALDAAMGEMAILNSLQRHMIEAADNRELLATLREAARILFGVDRLAYVLLNARTGVLGGRGIAGQDPLFGAEEMPLGAPSLLAAAARERRPRSSFETGGEAALLDRQFAMALEGEGILCLPMLGVTDVLGVVVLGLTAAHYRRLQARLPLLVRFGRMVATALAAWRSARDHEHWALTAAAEDFQRRGRRVVHEAGNPLGIIKSYLTLLERKLPEQVGVQREMGVLREEIDRIGAIIQRLSELPTLDDAALRVDANAVARELLGVYGPALFGSRGIELNVSYAPGPAEVACDRDSFKQILLNLIKNAAEAMAAGGRFAVEIHDRMLGRDGAYVQVVLRDTGPGMPDAALRRLCDAAPVPAQADGRGMGLSIVGALARRLDIEILCRSRAGEGTTLTLLFPAADDSAANLTAETR